MPLSEDLRDELASIAPTRDCDRLAELSGLFHAAGSVHLRGRGQVSVHVDVVSSAVARRAFSLLRALGIESEIRTYRRPAFDRGMRFQLHVPGCPDTLRLLHAAGVLDAWHRPLEHPPKRVVGRGCCRGAYLRGALLGSGSLSGPRDPHLEIRAAGRAGAEFVAAVAAQEGARLRVVDRARYAAAYTKGAETIVDVLGAAGADDVVLALEERSVVAATRSSASRLANADHANLVRSSRAAHAQTQAVRRLREAGRLEQLPPQLRELADLRLRHPTLSLRELARKCDPPATKASAYRRLRKLQQLAEP
ncbi:MAG: DNA-binding protein WhiA [Gaiellaceae bacterium]